MLFYVLAFCLTAHSLLGKFFTEFWGDRMDDLQNAWNLWWVKLALIQQLFMPVFVRCWLMAITKPKVLAAEPPPLPADDPEITVTTVYDRKGLQIYRLGCLCDSPH